MFEWLKKLFAPRTHCRVCGAKLHKPGGYHLPFAGGGFCSRCYTNVMREVNRCGT